jgi:tetratricopeptide (TPR) repeat protein
MRRALLAALAFLGAASAFADPAEGLRYLGRGQPEYAYREWKVAADAGDALSARSLGRLMERGVRVTAGQGVKADREEAIAWYRKALALGDLPSAELLAVVLVARGHAGDIDEALALFRRAGVEVDLDSPYLARYPADQRAEIAAWIVAFRSALQREARVASGSGLIEFEIDAGRRTITVVRSDVHKPLEERSLEAVRTNFRMVPPTLAAARNAVVIRETLDYTRR